VGLDTRCQSYRRISVGKSRKRKGIAVFGEASTSTGSIAVPAMVAGYGSSVFSSMTISYAGVLCKKVMVLRARVSLSGGCESTCLQGKDVSISRCQDKARVPVHS
jgi:hypothetical protein